MVAIYNHVCTKSHQISVQSMGIVERKLKCNSAEMSHSGRDRQFHRTSQKITFVTWNHSHRTEIPTSSFAPILLSTANSQCEKSPTNFRKSLPRLSFEETIRGGFPYESCSQSANPLRISETLQPHILLKHLNQPVRVCCRIAGIPRLHGYHIEHNRITLPTICIAIESF